MYFADDHLHAVIVRTSGCASADCMQQRKNKTEIFSEGA